MHPDLPGVDFGCLSGFLSYLQQVMKIWVVGHKKTDLDTKDPTLPGIFQKLFQQDGSMKLLCYYLDVVT